MLKLVLSSVRHSLGRYIATLVAIIAGVGFFTAVSVVSDGVISSLDGNVDAQYGPVDVAVVPKESEGSLTSAAQPEPIKVPQKTVDELLQLDGVEGGAGVLAAPTSFADAKGKAYATSAIGRLWVDDDELNPLSVTKGEAPTGAGEIAVDRGLAEEEDLAVGDDLTLLTLAGEQQVTLVGITAFGDSDAIDSGGTVSIAPADAFAWLGSGKEEYDAFYLRGSGGDDLVDEAKAVVGSGLTAQTGDEFRDDQRQESGQFAQTLKRGLQAFAVLALLVGGFVIYNTFSVIVAQRMRELAVLAAIGATPKQLKRSLRMEGLVLGIAGSLLGVAAGYALTLLLQLVLKATGNDLPGGLTFSASNVVSGVLLGTIITVLSVLSPARRAGRTEPMEAMREAAVESADLGKGRLIVAVAMAVLGVAGMVAGSGLVATGIGAVAFIGSVFVAAPYLARGGARVSRPLLHRFGLEGRLAVDNSVRSPKRTATTANALLIGVFLVTFVAVSGASLRDWIVDQVDDAQSADYIVFSQGGTIDQPFVDEVTGVKGVDGVVAFQRQALTIDGKVATASSGDVAEMRDVAAIEADKGSLDDLTDGTIAVLDDGSADAPSVGDTVSVAVTDGQPMDLSVVAVLKPTTDTGQTGSIIDAASFDQIVGDAKPTIAFVDLADDAGKATDDALVDVTERRPDITAIEGNIVGELISTIMDFLIRAVTGLLLMSVVIALIGIVNTMSLSILERRRELGLLRIIGMTDKRVRRMVRAESVLISLLGTIGGLVLGLVVSLLMVLSINRQSEAAISPSIPWWQLLAILLLGVVLGVLAAILPARRSTRLEVLDAVAAT
jgi:putative ABC transport system permease protein